METQKSGASLSPFEEFIPVLGIVSKRDLEFNFFI
jgi:hypothetical protein